MNVSIEITLTPLQDHYEEPIKDFIRVLRKSSFQLIETPLSTQIYCPLAPLMELLSQAIATCFDEIAAGMIHLKIVKSDRSTYVPFS